MPQWTNWKSLRSNRKGLIADTPCTGFRFRYPVDMTREYWEFDPPTGTAHFSVEIKGPDGTLLFKQRVSFRYTYVTLVANGLLLIFTWWVDMQNARVDTTVPAPPVPTIGTEQPYVIADSFGDVIAGTAHMSFTYYSAEYLIPLPAGSTLDVREMNVGVGLMDADGIVQTSVIQGGVLSGRRLSQDGMTRILRPVSGGGLEYAGACDVRGLGARGVNAWPHSGAPAPSAPQVLGTVETSGAGNSRLLYRDTLLPWALYEKGNKLVAKTTFDDGRTWGAAMTIDPNIRLAGAAIGPDGGTIYVLGVRGTSPVALVCSVEAGGVLRKTDEFTPEGLPSIPAGLHVLELQNGTFHLLVQQGRALQGFWSFDGMRSWLG